MPLRLLDIPKGLIGLSGIHHFTTLIYHIVFYAVNRQVVLASTDVGYRFNGRHILKRRVSGKSDLYHVPFTA